MNGLILQGTIGEHLLQLMAQRELTAAQLAKMAHVKPSYLYDIIHGKSKNPSILKLAQIAKALDVDLSSLLGEQPDTIPQFSLSPFKRKLGMNMPDGSGYADVTSITMEKAPNGAVITRENKQTPYLFSQELFRSHLSLNPQDVRMVHIRSDGMKPALIPGDTVLIDITKKHPSPPGIFVLFDGFSLIAKRLEILPNAFPPTMRVISDNAQYATYECPIGELHIVGRVIWFARTL